MTLIVNLLHRDFSLIAADKLANATGPATITTGGLTIKMPNGGKIEGLFPKVIGTANGCAAVGSAGTIAEHTFVGTFKAATSPGDALAAVRIAAHDFFDFAERDTFLAGTGQMVNESIVSFFDEEKSAFWTFIIKYTRFDSHQFAYARRQNPKPHVFSVGSGNPTLSEKVSNEEIQRFTAAISEEWNEPQLDQWLAGVFQTVSDANESVSASFDALIATRDNPVFRPLARSTVPAS
ncbi:hypothetical protein [Ralstonia sp. 3PA37C10]|jgi:hypothetical protein|uniref:hypothetical protein n=1 Tax=Ralstonia TaxID=48736 RepID=UPI0010F8F237|nr:hypothetical protein [Ralstonia sp. 3PA37C10]